jgi:biopolymer transport protein ExbB
MHNLQGIFPLWICQVTPPNKPQSSDGLLSIIFSGGILGVAIMLTLIALSLATVYMVIELSFSLRRKEIIPADFVENVRLLMAQGKLKEADSLCRERPSPIAFIVASGISEIEFGWTSVEKSLEDATGQQAARLYRKIEYLSVLGNLAPMLGLLGTVSGMILAFREVALSQGTAGAGDLAQGIYSALVTTVAGLIIAIPALAAYAIFRNSIDQLIVESVHAAQSIFAPIRRRIPGSGAARVVPPSSIPVPAVVPAGNPRPKES